LAFEMPKQVYSGNIVEVTIGTGSNAVTLGGENSYPFHVFEGDMPHPPIIAMEIWDYDPSDEWPQAAVEPFKDVISSPDAWAKKCVEEYGADAVVIQLKATDPNGMDRGPDETAELVKKVLGAIDVPLILWGTANNEKDEEVMKKVCEVCDGENILLCPIEEPCHKGVGAAALGYKHTVGASTPIDVNLAKQLNILLENLGVPMTQIVVDPTTGGLGYGLEYSYSVMERIRMAALTQEDDKLQSPMINNIGNEVWKCKEAGLSTDDAPTLGDPEKRPILMETSAAVCFLMAGSDVLILRHPETVRLTRAFIERMTNGGASTDIEGISKQLEAKEVDLVSLSPEPNLDFGEAEAKEKPKAEAKKEKAPPKEAPKEEKAEEKVVEMKAKEAEKKKAEEKPAKEEKKAEEDPVEAAAKKLGLDLEAVLKKHDASRQDVKHTAEKHGLSIEDVLKKLGG